MGIRRSLLDAMNQISGIFESRKPDDRREDPNQPPEIEDVAYETGYVLGKLVSDFKNWAAERQREIEAREATIAEARAAYDRDGRTVYEVQPPAYERRYRDDEWRQLRPDGSAPPRAGDTERKPRKPGWRLRQPRTEEALSAPATPPSPATPPPPPPRHQSNQSQHTPDAGEVYDLPERNTPDGRFRYTRQQASARRAADDDEDE